MKNVYRGVAALSVWLMVSLVACGGDKEKTGEPSGEPTKSGTDKTAGTGPKDKGKTPATATKAAATSAPDGFPAPAARTVAGDDALYVATAKALLSVKDGKFTKVADLPRFFSPTAMTTDTKGALWLLSRNSVAKLEGSKLKTFKVDDGNGALKAFSVFDDNNIDVIGVWGVSHFDGKSWKLAKSKELLAGKSGGLNGVVVDGKGRGYVSSYKHLLIREAADWKVIKREELFGPMSLGADGTLGIAMSSGIIEATAEGWKKRGVSGHCGAKNLFVRKDKHYLVCHDRVVIVERANGAQQAYSLKKGGDIDVSMISTSAVDSQGRIYIGAQAGLFVIGTDGKVTAWKLGSVPLMTTGPKAVLAVGKGPAQLPGQQEIRYGKVKGKLLKKGKAIAATPIEICTNASSFMRAGETPCTKANWKTTATTGADGSFAFDKVPVGKLEFAYKPKGSKKWVMVMGFRCCEKLKEGQELDLGELNMR